MAWQRIDERDESASATSSIVQGVLGVWVFLSSFIWPHVQPQRANTWIVGALMAVMGFGSLSIHKARYLNTLLAAWLFISAFALPTMWSGTFWNNAIVGLVVFILSLSSLHREIPLFHRRPTQPV